MEMVFNCSFILFIGMWVCLCVCKNSQFMTFVHFSDVLFVFFILICTFIYLFIFITQMNLSPLQLYNDHHNPISQDFHPTTQAHPPPKDLFFCLWVFYMRGNRRLTTWNYVVCCSVCPQNLPGHRHPIGVLQLEVPLIPLLMICPFLTVIGWCCPA